MKWTFAIQQKLKAALLLGVLITLIIVTTILERKQIEHVDKYANSMYLDRLIPATDFFYLSEKLYNKRLRIETYFAGNEQDTRQLEAELTAYDNNIDSIILEYEKTYLVNQESLYLKNFKKLLLAYQVVEQSVIALCENSSKQAGQELYESQGKPLLSSILKDLHRLTEIQTKVGHELVEGSRGIVASAQLLSTLQIAVAIVIGILLQALVFSSKSISVTEENANLN